MARRAWALFIEPSVQAVTPLPHPGAAALARTEAPDLLELLFPRGINAP